VNTRSRFAPTPDRPEHQPGSRSVGSDSKPGQRPDMPPPRLTSPTSRVTACMRHRLGPGAASRGVNRDQHRSVIPRSTGGFESAGSRRAPSPRPVVVTGHAPCRSCSRPCATSTTSSQPLAAATVADRLGLESDEVTAAVRSSARGGSVEELAAGAPRSSLRMTSWAHVGTATNPEEPSRISRSARKSPSVSAVECAVRRAPARGRAHIRAPHLGAGGRGPGRRGAPSFGMKRCDGRGRRPGWLR